MSFIILSTGRAGSGYTAKLLTECGIPTGHELSYNLNGYNNRKFVGESSWLALPYVEEGVYPDNTTIYHQVRHPLKVIGSLVNGEMQTHKEYLDFQTRYLQMRDNENYLEYCARFVYQWNQRIEELTDFRWRVEDINFNTIHTIAFNEGIQLDRRKVVVALKAVSKRTNKHPNTKRIEWSDIQNLTIKDALQQQAVDYGYRI